MEDRILAYRTWAAECLDYALRSPDESLRTAFLTMAQRWIDLADSEIKSQPIAQQQQQIQPIRK